jgi:hypothetical protein
MYSLAKFATRRGRLGTALSSPYPVFDLENIHFRQGATSMIAGKPGAMKSTFALNMLARWGQEGLPVFYFAADSDEEEIVRRLAGILTGVYTEVVDADFDAGRIGRYMDAIQSMTFARFEYYAPDHQDPSEFIAERLAAFDAVYGDYPSIAFVDNAINFVETTDDWAGIRDMTRELGKVAFETGTHISVLHHASEGWGHPSDPVPSAAIQGKVTQIPRLVLTCAAESGSLSLKVACVKNRGGPSYPSANRWMDFEVQRSLKIEDRYQELL